MASTVQNGGVRPGAGRPVGSRPVRTVMREKLIAAYVAALGGADRVDPIVAEDIARCADMVLLARTARADLAVGKSTINDVVKLENAADRAQRRLNLPAPGTAAPVMSLLDHHAAQRASLPIVEEDD